MMPSWDPLPHMTGWDAGSSVFMLLLSDFGLVPTWA
jgi:hypothetical protein